VEVAVGCGHPAYNHMATLNEAPSERHWRRTFATALIPPASDPRATTWCRCRFGASVWSEGPGRYHSAICRLPVTAALPHQNRQVLSGPARPGFSPFGLPASLFSTAPMRFLSHAGLRPVSSIVCERGRGQADGLGGRGLVLLGVINVVGRYLGARSACSLAATCCWRPRPTPTT
jgi:hypothetical protein